MPKSVGVVSVSREQPAYEAACQHLLKASSLHIPCLSPTPLHSLLNLRAVCERDRDPDSVKAIITAKVPASP